MLAKSDSKISSSSRCSIKYIYISSERIAFTFAVDEVNIFLALVNFLDGKLSEGSFHPNGYSAMYTTIKDWCKNLFPAVLLFDRRDTSVSSSAILDLMYAEIAVWKRCQSVTPKKAKALEFNNSKQPIAQSRTYTKFHCQASTSLKMPRKPKFIPGPSRLSIILKELNKEPKLSLTGLREISLTLAARNDHFGAR